MPTRLYLFLRKEGGFAYNATALQELSHSTGHPTRLNRPQGGFFGSEQYAYEELVAEMLHIGRKAEAVMLTNITERFRYCEF